MVSVILTILKIIGIGILVILGIIILLVLFVLFVPVRYKAGGNYADNRADVSAKVHWLIGIAAVTVRYQSGQPFHIRAKLFYIPVFDNLKKHKTKKDAPRRQKKEEPQIQAASVSDNTADETDSDTEEPNKKEESSATNPLLQADNRTEDEFEKNKIEDENTDKITIIQKIKRFLIKFFEFFRKIKFTFRKIYVIMRKIKDNINYYLELLQQESTKLAFALCKKQLLRILKHVCPQKYGAKLHLGFEDPAVLGNVLAIWGMLYPLHMGRIDIQPEFEQTIAEGSFWVRGRISVYVFLWTAWLFLTDKNIRRLRKQLDL